MAKNGNPEKMGKTKDDPYIDRGLLSPKSDGWGLSESCREELVNDQRI